MSSSDLHQAVASCDTDLLRGVLARPSAGTVIDGPNPIGNTPLMCAAIAGSIAMTKMLVKGGASVGYSNASGKTALHLASFHGHDALVRYLISECGADPNRVDQGGSAALHFAADGGHASVIGSLVRHGAHVEGGPGAATTPLIRAASVSGRGDVVAELVQLGANVDSADKTGSTPLMIGVIHDHPECVRALLAGGADVAVTNRQGHSAIDVAKSFGRRELLALMLAPERPPQPL